MRYRKSIVLAVALAVALPLLVAAAPPPLPTLTEITKVRAAGPGSMLVRLAQDTTFRQPKGKSVPFAYDVDGLAAVALVQADPARGEGRLGVLSISVGRQWGRAQQFQIAIGSEPWDGDVELPAGRYWLHTVSDGEPVNVNMHVPTATGAAVFKPSSTPSNSVIDVPNQLPSHLVDEGRLSYSGGAVHHMASDGYIFSLAEIEASHVAVVSEHACLYFDEPAIPFPYLPGCPSLESGALYSPTNVGAALVGETFRLGSTYGIEVLEPATLALGVYRAHAGVTDRWKGLKQFSLEFAPQKR